MKRIVILISLVTLFLSSTNVNACAEIKNLKIQDATITKIGDTIYEVAIKEDTTKVTIEAQTDYKWVKGYEPRSVATNASVQLKVDGNPECGTTTYTLNFVTAKKKENTDSENINNNEVSTNSNNENDNDQNNTSTNTTEVTEEENDTVEKTVELKELVIEGYTLNFNPKNKTYDIEVNNDVTFLNIIATKQNETDKIIISENAKLLEVGKNVITVTIENSEGKSIMYEINATRKDNRSDNNFLSSLVISGYTLAFNPSVSEYTLNIGKESYLDISVVTQDKNATYQILNNSNLKNGSKITIKVTAEDKSVKNYIINITKKTTIMDYVNEYLLYIIIGGAVLILSIIVLIIVSVKKKKNKQKVEPENIANETETVGEVAAPLTAPTTQEGNETLLNNNEITPSTLEIIEPTNITGEEQAASTETNGDSSNTEVFKL